MIDSYSLIRDKCAQEIQKCEDNFADAEEKMEKFINFLKYKNYKSARENVFISEMTESKLKARLSCFPLFS